MSGSRCAAAGVLVLVLAACSGPAAPPRTQDAGGCPERVELADGVPLPEAEEPQLPLDVRDARLCRYDADGALRADEQLPTAGLADALLLPRAFPGQAPACAPDPAAVPVLLALSTAGGPLQVGTAEDPAGCAPTRVGALESAVHLGLPGAPDPDAPARCAPGRPGRSGQEAALVPGEPTGLVLCRTDGAGTRRRTGSAADLALVQQVLGEPQAQPSAVEPPCTPQVEGELHLSYAAGPPVLVRLRPGCAPSVDNGSLAAELPQDALRRLTALLPA